ncbi:MaoC family dehydratase [Catenuloplanes atrovinosus]|uniref:Acyl dehydratase n=1 Tax=Catenuloplanes atrovinosus TaxID=137266 RepID=A0AAE3YM21_9ACTN|nr:MaoC family dehydratase [Catenuloplanes atrovinosus]MDR7274674.1 acyl dehydratase [Catenuloplanes atrovinosus]
MRVFDDPAALVAAAGEHLGFSDWTVVGQPRIDAFAAATGDDQWIHVDPARAAQGPFGTTIAHGYLTLSLIPALSWQVYRIEGVRMGINYGLDRVRFPAPLPSGSRVRAGVQLVSVTPVGGDALQIAAEVTIEREGGDKPVCVARTLSRVYP